MAVEYHCCEAQFFLHLLIITFLVLFAGLMSGLTLGLMSLSLVDLEVLMRSGTPQDRKHAAKIMPVVKNQHLLLCTLLIYNAAAMEALPIFLDSLVTAWGAILISVTLILLFGEIIPQSVCSRYGLAIGAAVAPLVRVLVWICFPIAYPISKLLDFVLGDGHVALFRRAELKTLVTLHGNEAGKGGELTHDETTIIAGALELTTKTAKDAMTPLSQTFTIDINAKLDRNLMKLILEKGHSRVPVYYEQPTNIIGLVLFAITISWTYRRICWNFTNCLLEFLDILFANGWYTNFVFHLLESVKNLLTINPADEMPIKNVTIRKIPRVLEDMPLYDILNEFQKGHSHMAVVIRQNKQIDQQSNTANGDVILDIDSNKLPETEVINDFGDKPTELSVKKKRPIQRWKSYPGPGGSQGSNRGSTGGRRWSKDVSADVLQVDDSLPKSNEEEASVGVITMEDVIEELLQEEIYDETDNQD